MSFNIENYTMPYDNYPFWIISRILSRSIKRENGCIEYGGGNLKHKYGLISVTLSGHRMSLPAHRAMYIAVNQVFDLPSNIYIRHKCDNPCCVNIKHLEAGTAKDNARDTIERGRRAATYAPHTRQHKLTNQQVIDIKSCEQSQQWYADEYNITKGYVYKLQSGYSKPLLNNK